MVSGFLISQSTSNFSCPITLCLLYLFLSLRNTCCFSLSFYHVVLLLIIPPSVSYDFLEYADSVFQLFLKVCLLCFLQFSLHI